MTRITVNSVHLVSAPRVTFTAWQGGRRIFWWEARRGR